MRFISLLTISALLFTFLHCQQSSIVDPPDDALQDTLVQNITSCVILRLDSLKNNYTLDDKIVGYLKIINHCNTPFTLHSGITTLALWTITDKSDNVILSYPMGGYTAVIKVTLFESESYKESIDWNQSVYKSEYLKAYSGRYKLTANFVGNPLLSFPVIKRFEINEIGEPLSYIIAGEYPSNDSIKFHVILRNRITQPITYYIDQQPAVVVSFVQKNNTILTQQFNLPMQQVLLQPHSDNQIFRYLASKKDTVFAGMKGYFDVMVNITFRNKIISGKIWSVI